MSWFGLYLLFALPNLKAVLGFITLSCLVTLCLWAIIYGSDSGRLPRGSGKCFTWLVIASSLCAMLPTERQMMLIVGGYAATNIDGVEKLPENLVRAANEFLEGYYEEKEGNADE